MARLSVVLSLADAFQWAVIEGEENQAKVADYHRTRDLDQRPSDRLLLAEILYDPEASSPIQTTPIPAEIIELGIDVGIVIFKVTSNWGADLTCLYRVSGPERAHAPELKTRCESMGRLARFGGPLFMSVTRNHEPSAHFHWKFLSVHASRLMAARSCTSLAIMLLFPSLKSLTVRLIVPTPI